MKFFGYGYLIGQTMNVLAQGSLLKYVRTYSNSACSLRVDALCTSHVCCVAAVSDFFGRPGFPGVFGLGSAAGFAFLGLPRGFFFFCSPGSASCGVGCEALATSKSRPESPVAGWLATGIIPCSPTLDVCAESNCPTSC